MTNKDLAIIKQLLDGARALGACRKAQGIDTLDALAELFLSPQGREFCLVHAYPSAEQWEAIARHWGKEELGRRGFYINEAASRRLCRAGAVVAVGAGARLSVTLEGPDQLRRVIALHGAKVDIRAENYAVFEAIADGASDISITKDGTAIQL